MLRVMTAVVLAAVAQFGWGFLFWSSEPVHQNLMHKAPNEAALAEALKASLPESGTYFLPACPGMNADKAAQEAFEKAHSAGPLVQIHYHKDGYSVERMPVVMAAGFGHTVVTLVLAAALVSMALPNLQTYLRRVLFVFGLGVFAAVGVYGADLIWFQHSAAFTLGQAVFTLVAWLVSGGIMGAIIRPQAQPAQAAQPHHSSLAA